MIDPAASGVMTQLPPRFESARNKGRRTGWAYRSNQPIAGALDAVIPGVEPRRVRRNCLVKFEQKRGDIGGVWHPDIAHLALPMASILMAGEVPPVGDLT
jgi:hypothetical protein